MAASSSGNTYKVVASSYSGPGAGSCGNLQDGGMHYAELSTTASSSGAGDNFSALGGLPCGTPLVITYKGKTITATKADVGGGGSGIGGIPRVIDLFDTLASALNFPQPAGAGIDFVYIARQDGKPIGGDVGKGFTGGPNAATSSSVPSVPSAAIAQKALSGLRHTDFTKEYAKVLKPLDLFRSRFKVTAYTDNGTFDISSFCTQITWQEDSADTLQYADQSVPLTGTITMAKPALRQYKTLMPDAFNAMANPKTKTARLGATGVVIRLDVAYGSRKGAHWQPLWAMRCMPADQTASETVTLGEGGGWTLNLVDDTYLLGLSVDDWKFTKGKKTHKKGWLADEITIAVCRKYNVPVSSVAKGTAYQDVNITGTLGKSPLLVISDAYNAETAKTGKAYIMRWGAPTQQFPTGALEVVPFRRNSALLELREQITEATLSRSTNADFATWITATAKLKQPKGKTKKLTYEAQSVSAIKLFGLIHRNVDFGSVGSLQELQILAKRQLAYLMTPIRAAEIVNMGVATVRRGDAVRINIPEEGYGDTLLAVDTVPSSVNQKDDRHGKKNKQTSTALQQAALNDPTLFGVPSVSGLSTAAAKTLEGNLNAATSVPIQVADQGIAFVTSITHSLTAGAYSMDMTMSFSDILDPLDVQAEMDANIRAAKLAAAAAAAAKAGPKGSSGGGAGGSTPNTGGQANPAPGASWGRLDQGFDGNYDMAKGACAAYDGTIHGIRSGDSGWPGNGSSRGGPYFCVVNDDQSGPDYTRIMYYAEGASCDHADGTHVTAGQKVGTAIAQGGTGAPGNFEIGPAAPSFETLSSVIGNNTSASRAMVFQFSAWMQSIGAGKPSDTSAAGGP